MNDFNNLQLNHSSNSKVKVDDFTVKFLVPFGLVIISAISLWPSKDKLPDWVLGIIVIYLVIVLVKISVSPVKNIIIKITKRYSNNRFAKQMRPELRGLMNELNELLDSQRINTIPYFISHFNSLDKNRQQFTILQSWASSYSDNIKYHRNTEFLRDAAQMSSLVSQFTWVCEWVRQVLNNNEVREKLTKDVIADWNTAVRNISDFTSRVKRIMKSVNDKYNTSICRDYFQDVKPL